MQRKKTYSMMSALLIVFAMNTPQALALKPGDVIGEVSNTDIVAYINNYAIPSYAANGMSVIIAEDLRDFGFDVIWNSGDKTLTINRNSTSQPKSRMFKKTGAAGTKFADLLYTDINVYAGGKKLPSYAMNGYMMVPIESLNMLGEVAWVPEQRAIKLWVDDLHIREEMQQVEQCTPITPQYSLIDYLYTNYGYWRKDRGLTAEFIHGGIYALTVPGTNGLEIWFRQSDWGDVVDAYLNDYEDCMRIGGSFNTLFSGGKESMSETYIMEHLAESGNCFNISCSRKRGAATMYYLSDYYLGYTYSVYYGGRYHNIYMEIETDSRYNASQDSYCWMYLR